MIMRNGGQRRQRRQQWLTFSGVLLLVIVLWSNLELIRESTWIRSPLGSSKMKPKPIFSMMENKDSEHSNRYLCEFLFETYNDDKNDYVNVGSNAAADSLKYIDMDCGYDYGTHRLGNFLTKWYLTRMIAARAGVVLSGSCKSAFSVFRWMATTNIDPLETVARMGELPDDQTNRSSLDSWKDTCSLCLSNETKVRDLCVFPHGNHHPAIAFSRAIPLLQDDMASLVKGVMEDPDSQHLMFDDIAIHMRIGDTGKISSGRYGLIPFRTYQKYIPSGFNGSIGIVTAPFRQSRGRRPNDPALNEAVVMGAKEYLQAVFPNATISIRNNPQETHDVVFARLLSSKTMLFCAPSSYCLIPALGRNQAVGDTIMVQSSLFGSIPGWLGDLEQSKDSRLRYVSESLLTSTMLQKLSIPEIVSKLQEPVTRGRS
jgi:hypothetical protein